MFKAMYVYIGHGRCEKIAHILLIPLVFQLELDQENVSMLV